MNQLTKKLLWIFFLIYSNIASATDYYYVGTTTSHLASSILNWNTNPSGSVATSAGASNPTAANLFANGHKFDFNGKSHIINIEGCTFKDGYVFNSKSTQCSLQVGSSTRTNKTLTINRADWSTNYYTSTNINLNLQSHGCTVNYVSSGTVTLLPATYNHLSFANNGINTVIGLIPTSTTLTVQGNLSMSGKTLQCNGTLVFGANSNITSSSAGTAVIYGTLTDNRTANPKNHPWDIAFKSATIPEGLYNASIYVEANATLSGNISVNNLIIGETLTPYILNCSTYELSISGTTTFTTTSSDTSGINCNNGTLKFTVASTLPSCYLRTSISAATTRSNIANLIISCPASSYTTITSHNGSGLTMQLPTISNSCTILSGALFLEGGILKIDCPFTVTSTDGIIVEVDDTATTKLNLMLTNSALIINPNLASITYTPNSILYQTINNLEINFLNGGKFQLPESIHIPGDLDIYDDNNYLEIGTNTLNLTGTLTYSSGTGGFFIGGSSSKLFCSLPDATTIYMDQSSVGTSNLLSELKLNNANTLVMGTDLIVSDLKLGTGNFSINDLSLKIANSATRTTGTLIGSSASNLTCENTMTLYFDQTSGDENRTLRNLSIGGNSVTVTLGNWLNISGGTSSSSFGIVDVIAASNKLYTGGYLTLKSNAYGTAMISTSPGTLAYDASSNNGTLLVENYMPYLNRGRQYRFLSSPVSGGVFLQWRDSLNNRSGRGIHITGDKTKTKETSGTPTPIDSFDMSTTNFPSAFYYDETKAGSITGIGTNSGAAEDAGWIRLPQANDNTIENGKGYRILVRGDRTRLIVSGGSSTDYDANNTTIQTRGGYVAGPVNVPIINSGSNTNNGIHLVGNPYACAIDWQQVYYACSTTVDPTYVLYDPVDKSWQSYNANSTTPSSYQYISPGQGFLVYTTSTSSTNLVFPTAAKTTAQAGARVFTEIKTNHLVTHLRKDTTAADMNIIYFLKGATNYYDKYDAGHIQNDNVNLSSLDSTNTLYNINCLDSLTGSRIVPMSVYGTPKGSYTMTFSDVNTFTNHDIYLVDNFLNKTTKVDDMTQYPIEITEDKFSYAEGRLYINFEPKATSSIVSLTKTENFNINPNPVKDVINISMKKSVFGDLQYEIFNINGQILSKGSLNDGETRINSTDLSKGIYFITLKTNSETQTIKFIK